MAVFYSRSMLWFVFEKKVREGTENIYGSLSEINVTALGDYKGTIDLGADVTATIDIKAQSQAFPRGPKELAPPTHWCHPNGPSNSSWSFGAWTCDAAHVHGNTCEVVKEGAGEEEEEEAARAMGRCSVRFS
eukprot:Skav203272  [mRNA]  locus=scaffold2987:120805:122431:+ [translate_table: standard]